MKTRAPRRPPVQVDERFDKRVVTALGEPYRGRQQVYVQCGCHLTEPLLVQAASLRNGMAQGCRACAKTGPTFRLPTGDAWHKLAVNPCRRIGLRLRAYRTASGRPAEVLADRLGVEMTQFYAYERGVTRISTAEDVATLIGTTLPEIVAPFTHDEVERMKAVFAPAAGQPLRRVA